MSDADDAFFVLPPVDEDPAPPQPNYRSKPWQGAPPATIPALVPVERVLAAADDVAITITGLQVYPEGLEFELVLFSRPQAVERPDEEFDPMLFHPFHGRDRPADGQMLRLGVQFADGRKATNLGGEFGWRRPEDGGPLLQTLGGGGGGSHYRQSYWVWPLPDAGPLTVVCEWPSRGIAVTRLEIDGDTIRNAALRAQVVFSEDHLPEDPDTDAFGAGGWTSYAPRP